MRIFSMATVLAVMTLHPAIVGSSRPAESLTAARVKAVLPVAHRAAWMAYLDRSARQRATDQAALAQERAGLHGPLPASPKESPAARSIPAGKDAVFFRSPEALRLGETIISFQLPNGGWSKNLDMAGPPRLPGQSYMPNNLTRYPTPNDFDAPQDPAWNYAGTLDNDATTTELRYLAKLAAALPGAAGERFRAAYLLGLGYLLAAQFPNGGWPQVWPLEGGYHDAITFNDNAVTLAAEVLAEAAEGHGDYAFVPVATRAAARVAVARAVACIVQTQVVVAGQRTVWGQQHDALTLAPVAGRNFEPAALSTGESADLLLFLMRLPSPSPAVREAVEAGVAWLQANATTGMRWTGGRDTPATLGNPAGGRHLEADAGAEPLWPRYVSIATGKPVFGDRDKSIHDDVMELSLERRNGYAWYGSGPRQALDAYALWRFRKASR